MAFPQDQSNLAHFFHTVCATERQTDVYRQMLSEQPYFNPFLCFQEIDKKRTGVLTPTEFYQFLSKNKVVINQALAEILTSLYDWDGDGQVSYADFLYRLLPTDAKKREKAVKGAGDTVRISRTTVYALCRMFERELEGVRRAKRAVLRFYIETDWRDLFDAIVEGKRRTISPENLLRFLRRNGAALDAADLKAGFRVFDKDKDGEISFEDLMSSLKLFSQVSNEGESRNYLSASSSRIPDLRLSVKSPYSEERKPSSYSMQNSLRIDSPRDLVSYQFPPRSLSPKSSPKPFIDFLHKQLFQLQKLEAEKSALAHRPDFHPWTCFQEISVDRKKVLSMKDLQTGLEGIGIKTTAVGMRRLMYTFNSSADGKLRFSEFSNMISPSQSPMLVAHPTSSLHPSTRRLLVSVLRLQLESEEAMETARVELAADPGFKISAAFAILDGRGTGSVSKDEFEAVLEHSHLTPTPSLELFKRYDKNRDGKITYAEFVQEVAASSYNNS